MIPAAGYVLGGQALNDTRRIAPSLPSTKTMKYGNRRSRVCCFRASVNVLRYARRLDRCALSRSRPKPSAAFDEVCVWPCRWRSDAANSAQGAWSHITLLASVGIALAPSQRQASGLVYDFRTCALLASMLRQETSMQSELPNERSMPLSSSNVPRGDFR